MHKIIGKKKEKIFIQLSSMITYNKQCKIRCIWSTYVPAAVEGAVVVHIYISTRNHSIIKGCKSIQSGYEYVSIHPGGERKFVLREIACRCRWTSPWKWRWCCRSKRRRASSCSHSALESPQTAPITIKFKYYTELLLFYFFEVV
jgi:hypothetical protein